MPSAITDDVFDLLGCEANWDVVEAAVKAVTLMARAYVRGEGFDGDTPCAEIAAVICTASCRLARNPGQLSTSETMGPFGFEVRNGFAGFNLAELAVLDRYRIHGL